MDLAQALRRYQEATGRSQADLAEAAGVDQSTISRAMDGNYGRSGWAAAAKILGFDRVIRMADGSYRTPELAELVDLLGQEITKELEAGPAVDAAKIGDLQELIADVQRHLR